MTFPQPNFEVQEQIDRDTLQTRFPEFRVVANRTEKVLRIFHLEYRDRIYDDYVALRGEFIAAAGRAKTTSYTPVDEGTPVTVRFLSDEFRTRWMATNTFEMNIDLIEDPK